MNIQQFVYLISGVYKKDHQNLMNQLGNIHDRIEDLIPDSEIITDKKAQVGRDLAKIRNEFTNAWSNIYQFVLKHGSNAEQHAIRVLFEETKNNFLNTGMYHADIKLKISKESLFNKGGFLGKVVFSKRKLNALIKSRTEDIGTLISLSKNFKNVADATEYVISINERNMKR